MPYNTNRELPEPVKNHLPQHAQDIYRAAFNHAYEEYQEAEKRCDPGEEISHRVAWTAVNKEYEKDGDGDWVKKKK